MLLALDVGNSAIKLALFDGGNIIKKVSFSSLADRTEDEYAFAFSPILNGREISLAVISSVVPSLTEKTVRAVSALTGARTVTVGHGIRTGLDIRTDNQSELGSDIVANCVGARTLTDKAFIVVDLGTATTLAHVGKNNVFNGVMICPGVGAGLTSLGKTCANLPDIGVSSPKAMLGKNTADSVISGVVYGFASMIDGLVSGLTAGSRETEVFLCGGYGKTILPYCRTKMTFVPDLTLIGLSKIGELNNN